MNFCQALTSEKRNAAVPEEFDFFGKLIGSWKIDYVNSASGCTIKGEWHFSRALEGMAVQDVIILPEYEYGTTVRVYNPVTNAWDAAYCFAGKIIRLEAKKQGEKIVLSLLDNEKRKWVFNKIETDKFHWSDVSLKDNGNWSADFDIYAERI